MSPYSFVAAISLYPTNTRTRIRKVEEHNTQKVIRAFETVVMNYRQNILEYKYKTINSKQECVSRYRYLPQKIEGRMGKTTNRGNI